METQETILYISLSFKWSLEEFCCFTVHGQKHGQNVPRGLTIAQNQEGVGSEIIVRCELLRDASSDRLNILVKGRNNQQIFGQDMQTLGAMSSP